MNNKKERVLVTGATGYIASHVIKKLLEKNYSVRGTVRNLKNDKCDDLKKDNIFGLSGQSIELVEANLDSNEGWREALSECGEDLTHIRLACVPSRLSQDVEAFCE